ncbi:hypothetical protein HIM_06372 [Hirsutella minnesotensis 3608]|uniref:Uncharacterized protein n=1 Tax=Hirsutella minnesotensis 3608 TaxID=1043627 RepID=A0A0F7ZJ46_9HYPO|nr:hypothetical protein HIM_06372 [Hirsutella minnesotensis 3608]
MSSPSSMPDMQKKVGTYDGASIQSVTDLAYSSWSAETTDLGHFAGDNSFATCDQRFSERQCSTQELQEYSQGPQQYGQCHNSQPLLEEHMSPVMKPLETASLTMVQRELDIARQNNEKAMENVEDLIRHTGNLKQKFLVQRQSLEKLSAMVVPVGKCARLHSGPHGGLDGGLGLLLEEATSGFRDDRREGPLA